MILDKIKIGNYIQNKRKMFELTQSELSEKLMISPQSISNWERGESLPDVTMLPDLALILHCSVDEILAAGSLDHYYRRRISVEMIRQAISSIENLRSILGPDHFMYRTMIDALDQKMNSEIEMIYQSERAKDAYICEMIIECINHGDYIDLEDIRRNIHNEKARDFTIRYIEENMNHQ